MDIVIFDIETNAIKNFRTLLGLKTIHCISLATPTTDAVLVPIDEALERLRLADVIVGHNIQSFDIPAIQRLYTEWKPEGCVRDTLVMSRMLWPDIQREDWQTPEFPKNLAGRHSLKSWGYRLGMLKGDFGETTDWEVFTEEMGQYCCQDVEVTKALWNKIEGEKPSDFSTMLEHEFAQVVQEQETNGFAFDVDAARELHSELLAEKDSIQRSLKNLFPPVRVEMKTPQFYVDPIDDVQYTLKGDAPVAIRSRLLRGKPKYKETPFNPSSRVQIANNLINKYGWQPEEFTGEGRPKVDESVLSQLEYPEAKVLVRYLTIIKRLGQLADGREAWLRVEQDGRIHGRVNPCGAVTSRCTHSSPNLAQVPRVGALWGTECRELFIAPHNHVLVGVDMKGLELRCLAHYTYKFDGGKYVKEILEGDIHEANRMAAGLEDRNDAKTFIYAFLYGAGDAKLGSIVDGGRVEGSRMRSKFLKKMPAIERLQSGIKLSLQSRNYLKAIDGRHLRIRSQHSALNTLLQSAGAIAMKLATCILHRKLRSHGWDKDVLQVAHIHDEIQLQVRTEIAEDVGRLAVQSMCEAGEELKFRCPLDGDYKIGRNWAETH